MAGVKNRSGRKRAVERKERLDVYVPPKLVDRLIEIQAHTGKSISAIVVELIESGAEISIGK